MYATRADIEKIYGGDQLRSALDLAADAVLNSETEQRVAEALGNATSTIDSYVSVVYALPLAAVPDALSAACVDIALYQLALRTGRVRDELRKRYEDAIKFLSAVSAGKARLAGAEPPSAAEPGVDGSASGGVRFTSRPRTFGRDRGLLT